MFTGIRLGRIMPGEPGLLREVHVRSRLVRRPDRPRVLRLVQLAVVAGEVAEAAVDAGEV